MIDWPQVSTNDRLPIGLMTDCLLAWSQYNWLGLARTIHIAYVCTVYIRYFRQKNHHTYGHICLCIYGSGQPYKWQQLQYTFLNLKHPARFPWLWGCGRSVETEAETVPEMSDLYLSVEIQPSHFSCVSGLYLTPPVSQRRDPTIPSQLCLRPACHLCLRPVSHRDILTPVSHLEIFTPVSHREIPTPVSYHEILTPVSHREIFTPKSYHEILTPVSHCEIPTPVSHREILTPVPYCEISTPVSHLEILTPVSHREILTPVSHLYLSKVTWISHLSCILSSCLTCISA
jgi:hypothetical protein